jgi:hypothetical protein
MKKFALLAIALLFAAVPMFAAQTGSDQLTISLTIAAGTTITPTLDDTVTIVTSTGTGNSVTAGTITLATNTDATWWFKLVSQNTAPNKGKLVSENGDTFDYTVSLGSILASAPASLTTDKKGSIAATAGNSTIATLKIHYNATTGLNAGTYTDIVKIFFYDSEPVL